MRPKGSLWKLIGKHITLTKAKILKISKTNKTVLRKFTNPLCLNASFSSWFAQSTAINYACQTEIGISGNTTLYQQAVSRSILRELDCQINMFWTQSLTHISFNFWYVNLKFCIPIAFLLPSSLNWEKRDGNQRSLWPPGRQKLNSKWSLENVFW